MLTPEELIKKIMLMPDSFYLVDLRNIREDFYALTEKDLEKYPLCISGVYLCYVMDGKLTEAKETLGRIPKEMSIVRRGCELVNPEISWKDFMDILSEVKGWGRTLGWIILTASRPYLLNGVNDFTRLYPFLERKKDLFMEYAGLLYGRDFINVMHKLCVAEYKYQQSDLLVAEVSVSQTVKEFDKRNEQRFLFVALYLMGKILLTQGRTVKALSYIKSVRNFIKKNGMAEFSYNLDAAETLFALYEGDFVHVRKWMEHDAPDEFSNFNMLDLYRYMVKMRCYIVMRKYPSVVALAEKLRPLLEAGKRHMDLCEIDLLMAMSLWCAGEKNLAFEAMDRAVKIARRRKYFRLIADEGDVMLNLLIDWLKVRKSDAFIMRVVELTRSMAIAQPLYLKTPCKSDEVFSQMEIDMLKLLEHGKTKEEIGEYFFISVNTVKYHMKSIYSKLGAKSPHQAVWNAKVMGII